MLTRRQTLVLAVGPWLALGCDKTPSVPPAVKKAGKVIVAIAKKVAKYTSIAVDLNDLYVEIMAIIEGKEELVSARITREEGEILRSGGQLIIKGADGTEVPVSHQIK